MHGDVTFADDLTDVQALSEGGSLIVRDYRGAVSRAVEIKRAGGRITREYFVAGVSRGWTDEGRRFLADELPGIVRNSGIGADRRVGSIFAKKGVAGVLAEIDLVGGDYGRRAYLTALVDVAHLDSAGVMPVLQRVERTMASDYDRRLVLEKVAALVKLDGRGAGAYVAAMAAMRSDFDQREALSALTKSGARLDGAAAFQAVAHMHSSYDKRVALVDILARGDLNAETRRALLGSVVDMSSDYDRREVLTAYLQKNAVDAVARDSFFAAVDAMRSDYDRAETLLACAGGRALDAETRASVLASAGRLKSKYDQDRVRAALGSAERR